MGTTKLFSDQKGLRFITPSDGGDQIFIYQSTIRSKGFRSFVDDEASEFDVEPGNACCTKVVNDTGPDGAPIKGGPVMVEVVDAITMVLEVDIDVEVGDMVVLKMVTVVGGGMEIMVHMAAMMGTVVEVAMGMVPVVEEEVGVPSMGKLVIQKENVDKVGRLSISTTLTTFP
ncbi:hypothetical protein RDI58_003919 [Solanum bulbocastanum]|uniref:CSD domain-containing protein n=1 Tax=Solanum bulbocastanum TaxID=147425 RepID=A0AAN8TX08_SOLBU